MIVESPFGIGKPPTSEGVRRVIFSSEMPVKTKPLTPEEIANGMRKFASFDLHQQRAEALGRG